MSTTGGESQRYPFVSVMAGGTRTGRLETGAADEEAVDVLLLAQVLAVLLVDAAAVEDAGLVGHLGADVGLQPPRMAACTSWACCVVATLPVPMAQMGS